jgi:hypothetical protein
MNCSSAAHQRGGETHLQQLQQRVSQNLCPCFKPADCVTPCGCAPQEEIGRKLRGHSRNIGAFLYDGCKLKRLRSGGKAYTNLHERNRSSHCRVSDGFVRTEVAAQQPLPKGLVITTSRAVRTWPDVARSRHNARQTQLTECGVEREGAASPAPPAEHPYGGCSALRVRACHAASGQRVQHTAPAALVRWKGFHLHAQIRGR